MQSTGNDILQQYRSISHKLKSSFLRHLRKPNIAEAYESFTSLAKHCESQELPAYAGLCWIAAARCERSVPNSTEETSCLINSARQFLNAEKNDFDLGCQTVSGEYLQTGLSSYAHASSRIPETSAIQVNLNLEVVDFLKRIDRSEFVQPYLQDALIFSKGRSSTYLHCLELLADHFTKIGDYFAALETYSEMSRLLENGIMNGCRTELLLKCEVNCVFLLLILRPSPKKIVPEFANILEKYTWGDKNDATLKACRMTDKMFLLLKSLVNICQSWNTTGLIELESHFWPLLWKEGIELLRVLVKTYRN